MCQTKLHHSEGPTPPMVFSVPKINKKMRCGEGVNVHLLTHATARGVDKNQWNFTISVWFRLVCLKLALQYKMSLQNSSHSYMGLYKQVGFPKRCTRPTTCSNTNTSPLPLQMTSSATVKSGSGNSELNISKVHRRCEKEGRMAAWICPSYQHFAINIEFEMFRLSFNNRDFVILRSNRWIILSRPRYSPGSLFLQGNVEWLRTGREHPPPDKERCLGLDVTKSSNYPGRAIHLPADVENQHE